VKQADIWRVLEYLSDRIDGFLLFIGMIVKLMLFGTILSLAGIAAILTVSWIFHLIGC
jgi:hypothetical protein